MPYYHGTPFIVCFLHTIKLNVLNMLHDGNALISCTRTLKRKKIYNTNCSSDLSKKIASLLMVNAHILDL